MAEADRPEAKIYQLRAVIRGISPMVWRRLLVRDDSAVAQIHEVLQLAFGWDDVHLNRFEIRGREYAAYREGGGLISTDARRVRLSDLKLRRLERFIYEYDFGDSWIHDLRLETALPVNPRTMEELDEFEDELDDEFLDSFDDYDPDRFDRRRINRALQRLAAGS
jgi:hypothetical protein